MGAVTTPLIDRAESIFTDLGYAVSTEGTELRAERKWRTVHVTPLSDTANIPDTGRYRCFVTPRDRVDAAERELRARDPDYEWAIIGVADDSYEVSRGT